MNILHSTVFTRILSIVRNDFQKCNIKGLKTYKGNTQVAERTYIEVIRDVLKREGYTFTEAGSQQPYDFRINMEDGSIMFMEAKKTDSMSVYFNDTCPSSDAFYIIVHTGKHYKAPGREDILPCVFGVNGEELIEDDKEWLEEFKLDLVTLKEKYKSTGVHMSVYPRPTYKTKIYHLFEKYYDEAKIVCEE